MIGGDRMNNAHVYMSVSETNHLKSIIVGAGYNITSLASAIGMGREMLSARINGKTDFSRHEMNDISKVLNKNPADIFFIKEVT